MIKKFFNFYETGEHKIFVIFGIKISVKKKKKNGKTIEDIMNYYDKKINAITNEIKTNNFLLKEIYLPVTHFLLIQIINLIMDRV